MPTPNISLRDYVASDFSAICELDQLCFEEGVAYTREEMRDFLQRSKGFTLIAEFAAHKQGIASYIAGFIILDRDRKGSGHVITLDVHPDRRKNGVGSALLSAAEHRLKAAGAPANFLEVAVDNLAALAFYKRHEYSVFRRLPGYYKDGVDGLLMGKSLKAAG